MDGLFKEHGLHSRRTIYKGLFNKLESLRKVTKDLSKAPSQKKRRFGKK